MGGEGVWIGFRVLEGKVVNIGVFGVRQRVVDQHLVHP